MCRAPLLTIFRCVSPHISGRHLLIGLFGNSTVVKVCVFGDQWPSPPAREFARVVGEQQLSRWRRPIRGTGVLAIRKVSLSIACTVLTLATVLLMTFVVAIPFGTSVPGPYGVGGPPVDSCAVDPYGPPTPLTLPSVQALATPSPTVA